MTPAASRYPRYHLLDPLRGVAIGCVLAAHFTSPGVAASMFHDLVVPATRHGYIGMRLTGLNGWWWPVFCAAALAVTMAVGVVFFRLCEKPWMNFPSASRKAR